MVGKTRALQQQLKNVFFDVKWRWEKKNHGFGQVAVRCEMCKYVCMYVSLDVVILFGHTVYL